MAPAFWLNFVSEMSYKPCVGKEVLLRAILFNDAVS